MRQRNGKGRAQVSDQHTDKDRALSVRGGSRVDVACFTKGTMIGTPTGEKPVENLKTGDRVLTRDNGIQEVRWAGAREIDWHTLTQNVHVRPVLIRKGALGDGLPVRNMMLSPNHRVLVPAADDHDGYGETEILASARHLIGNPGVQEVEAMGVTYLHLLFDRHEIILSDGAWSESFQPSDFSLRAVGNAQRLEILDLFPELGTRAGIEKFTTARPVAAGKNTYML